MTPSYPVTVTAPHYDAAFKLMHGGSPGAWQFYTYGDVQKILFDATGFSNNYMPATNEQMLGSNINQVDPPLHGMLRKLINTPFSSGAIDAQEPFIYEVCSRFLPIKNGFMEFAHDFAFPCTTAVICRIIGVPAEYHTKVNGWAKAILNTGYHEDGLRAAAMAQQEMAGMFLKLLLAREKEPKDDLLTLLADSDNDDMKLALPVKLGTCMTILLAGFETTANLAINCIHTLTEIPGLQQILHASPWQIPIAIQEVLRLKPSLVSMYRKATHDMDFGGCAIQEGDMVNAWISVANRDPEIFSDPQHFDLTRPNLNKVLSFGYGIHHCVGAGLARAQVRIALELMVSKFKNIRLAAGTELSPVSSQISSGFQSLPIIFNT